MALQQLKVISAKIQYRQFEAKSVNNKTDEQKLQGTVKKLQLNILNSVQKG